MVAPGEFVIAAAFLDHGHVYGQVAGLLAAGATLRSVHDPDPRRLREFTRRYPEVKVEATFEALLEDDQVHLVVSAAIPNRRGAVGAAALRAGKHYFTDKSPFTSLDQLAEARLVVAETKRIHAVYYAERLHNRPTWAAGELIVDGAIGRVLQVLIVAPHNLAAGTRPAWFFDKEAYGGILTDIGSHQFEQFLYFTGSDGVELNFARVENFGHPEVPELEDFGEASVSLSSGASGYCRLDWFNPAASRTWGDGRAVVLGTDGYIEIRKNVDVGRTDRGGHVLLVNNSEERVIEFTDEPFPYFGRLIIDCLQGTETAMTQAHTFAAAESSMRAQELADSIRSDRAT